MNEKLLLTCFVFFLTNVTLKRNIYIKFQYMKSKLKRKTENTTH